MFGLYGIAMTRWSHKIVCPFREYIITLFCAVCIVCQSAVDPYPSAVLSPFPPFPSAPPPSFPSTMHAVVAIIIIVNGYRVCHSKSVLCLLQESSCTRSWVHKGLIVNLFFLVVLVVGVVLGEVYFPLEGVRGRELPLRNDTDCLNNTAGTNPCPFSPSPTNQL